MTTTGPLSHDEEGNDLPVPPAASDLAQLIQLLEYGRRRGFRIGPTIRVGSIVTSIIDLRQDELPRGAEGPGEIDPWVAAGHLEGE